MTERYFTPEEANELLAEVRPLAESMVRYRRALAEAEARRAELLEQIASNGGDLVPSDVADATSAVAREATALAGCVEAIQELGAQVKDLELGLVDFPARRGEEVVLLCWRVGEDEIAYWHGLEEGFAGRKPLPL